MHVCATAGALAHGCIGLEQQHIRKLHVFNSIPCNLDGPVSVCLSVNNLVSTK